MLYSPPTFCPLVKESLLEIPGLEHSLTDLGITATPYSLKKTCQKGIMEPHSLCPPLQTANAFFTWLSFILIPVNQAGLCCKETGSAKV